MCAATALLDDRDDADSARDQLIAVDARFAGRDPQAGLSSFSWWMRNARKERITLRSSEGETFDQGTPRACGETSETKTPDERCHRLR